MAGKFELYKDKAGEFRFRLKAGNGETILASEGYKQKSSAMNGIDGSSTTQALMPPGEVTCWISISARALVAKTEMQMINR